MDRKQRQLLLVVAQEVSGWVDRAQRIAAHRAEVAAASNRAVGEFRSAAATVGSAGSVDWRALPLRPTDGQRLAAVARGAQLPALTDSEQQALTGLTSHAAQALPLIARVTGIRRFFIGKAKRAAGARAAELITEYQAWGTSTDLTGMLERLGHDGPVTRGVPVEDALAGWVGLVPRIEDLGEERQLLGASTVAGLSESVRAIDGALAREDRLRGEATDAGNALRNDEARRLLAAMPVERLREATRHRLRTSALTDAGISNVQAVLDRGRHLEQLPGIAATTASRTRDAARTLWQATYDETPVRIDIADRNEGATRLLRRLREWESVRSIRAATTDLALKSAFAALAQNLDDEVSHLVVIAGDRPVSEFPDAVQRVVQRAEQLPSAPSVAGATDPWEDFLARPADYFALLAELGFLLEDEAKTHGDLPDDIVEAVRRMQLDTEYLTASLRGYQRFGARFALVQRKVVIGDEMGLGKTVEALAVLAHLRARGSSHFLVICPAAVVTNWVREVESKTLLQPHRVHGPDRAPAAHLWAQGGGVAVTTYETMNWLQAAVKAPAALGCVVVDEAHYVKNPAAQRSRRTAAIIGRAEHAVLLTGTPMENRIEEFRTLIGYLRPDLIVDATEVAPRRFRRQVAPAYLRRNQEDVLTELPELVEVEEWLPMSSDDLAAYRRAVEDGNFMAMRQAAIRHGGRSQKMDRLIEIVAEAEDNGRRVIVFSHFLDVLRRVSGALPGQVFGPMTGSMPAAARQVLVDQFSAADHGAVLVSQIVAGGVGLNIQAASVVVICEPQLKPTIEWQAIARAHRMGQLQSVQVHRLLSEEGVDQRVTGLLARKRALFEDFARISETAGSAPEAFDISEAEIAREVVAAERERLLEG